MKIRNITNIELTTDVLRADKKGNLIIKPFEEIDENKVDKESLKASLEKGRLKNMVEKKILVVGNMIKGDAKEAVKIPENKIEDNKVE